MNTEIFKTYSDFLAREDKRTNGVNPEFAEAHPNYKEENKTNRACWNCSNCSNCSSCFECSECSECSRCSECSECFECSECSGCSECSECFECFECFECSECSNKNGEKENRKIPIIENIHSMIIDAASKPKALNMADWHTCDTTHCRAGWAVHLAGEEGYKLEKETSTAFSAFQIYKASSDIKVSFPMFYIDNEESLKDMNRCADLEKNK